MRCPKCGQENPAGKIVCNRCGTRLRPGAGPAVVAATPERFMAWLRADLVKLAVVLVIVMVMAVALGTLVR
jgi:uncharacterized membrane protein YvbJ